MFNISYCECGKIIYNIIDKNNFQLLGHIKGKKVIYHKSQYNKGDLILYNNKILRICSVYIICKDYEGMHYVAYDSEEYQYYVKPNEIKPYNKKIDIKVFNKQRDKKQEYIKTLYKDDPYLIL